MCEVLFAKLFNTIYYPTHYRRGVLPLTPLYVLAFSYNYVVFYRANFMDDTDFLPEAEAEMTTGVGSESGVRTRKYFPETFIWEQLNTG